MRHTFRNYLADERGTSAAEFAIVATVAIGLILTVIGMSALVWTSSSLHFAVEAAARCYAIGAAHSNTNGCSTSANAITFATSRYMGPNLSPTFTATTAACGYQVSGTVTFPLSTGIFNVSIPLGATSCYSS
jgi:Flp pilus assembly protein TadG